MERLKIQEPKQALVTGLIKWSSLLFSFAPFSRLSQWTFHMCMLSHSVGSDSLGPHGLQPARLLCSWNFSRQEYWSGLPFPSAMDLPTRGIEPRSPDCRQILYCLSHLGIFPCFNHWTSPLPSHSLQMSFPYISQSKQDKTKISQMSALLHLEMYRKMSKFHQYIKERQGKQYLKETEKFQLSPQKRGN